MRASEFIAGRASYLYLAHMETNEDFTAALAAVTASTQKLADRIYTPWWYHPALGGFIGLLLLATGDVFDRDFVILPIAAVGIISLGPLYRRISGINLYGPHAPDGGPTGRAILAILVAALTTSAACSYLLGRELGWTWAPWILAVVMPIGTTLAGRAYDEQLRAQVRASQA